MKRKLLFFATHGVARLQIPKVKIGEELAGTRRTTSRRTTCAAEGMVIAWPARRSAAFHVSPRRQTEGRVQRWHACRLEKPTPVPVVFLWGPAVSWSRQGRLLGALLQVVRSCQTHRVPKYCFGFRVRGLGFKVYRV